MDQPPHIHTLANELLNEIVLYLLDQRRTFNTEANGNGHTSRIYGEGSDLDRFRLVCRRFMRIGTPHTFSRFTLRFSEHGFRRLDELLEMQLARHVKSFTYMVRPFYQGDDWPEILRELETIKPDLFQIHSRRYREQTDLTFQNYDQTRLRLALAASTTLQEITLLRLQDDADEFLYNNMHTSQTATFTWEPACTRAITNISIALMNSKSRIRFIAPQIRISPETTLKLIHAPSTSLSAIAPHLTSLDINIPSKTDLTNPVSSLTNVFSQFFKAAQNLTAIHIGFSSKHPLDLDLNAVFRDIRWERLRKLSIHGWRLHASEIIAIAHKTQLRDLRLVGIYLRSGYWSDVLSVLREEMNLRHFELREIDYASHFDSVMSSGAGSYMGYFGPLGSSLDDLAGSYKVWSSAFGVQRFKGVAGVVEQLRIDQLRTAKVKDLGDDGVRVVQGHVPFWEAWVICAPERSGSNGVSWNM